MVIYMMTSCDNDGGDEVPVTMSCDDGDLTSDDEDGADDGPPIMRVMMMDLQS